MHILVRRTTRKNKFQHPSSQAILTLQGQVTNDDGPPSAESSPYVLPFVRTLESAGHTVSVVLPDSQRSWIGKAHMVGQDVQATHYWPPQETPETHSAVSSSAAAAPDEGKTPWVLVNSTPASCAQLGLSRFFFQERGEVDLVSFSPFSLLSRLFSLRR